MPFYITERYYNIEGKRIRIMHNIITGGKKIYVDGVLENHVETKLFEWCFTQQLNINRTMYELVITPRWYGFDYKVKPQPREYGYGLLDESLV